MQKIKYIYSTRFKHFLESTSDYTNCSFIFDLINLEGQSLEKDYFEGTYIDFGKSADCISFVDAKTILKEFKKESNIEFELWFNSKEESFWSDKKIDFDFYLYEKYAIDNKCLYWKKHAENVMAVETTEEIKSLFCSIGNKKAKLSLPYLDTMLYNRKTNTLYK
jgi:aspartyl/asparaginyl-tRNA synthetase